MELIQGILSRRSIRRFRAEKVSRETVEKIVAAASYAPSWKNTQTVRYYVFEDQERKTEIARKHTLGFTYNTGTIEHAPQVVAVTAVKGKSGAVQKGAFTTAQKENWMLFDAGAACQTFCLAAREYGVGTVIMGIFDAEMVAKLLHIPEDEQVICLICMGYPEEDPKAPVRMPVEDLLHFCDESQEGEA